MRHKMERRVVERLHVPAKWLGYAWVARESVRDFFARSFADPEPAGRFETIHPRAVAHNPLPCNITRRSVLPDDAGWWGYSFHDVPERVSGETFLATLPRCRIAPHVDPADGEFYVAVIDADDRALALREMAFRRGHGPLLRSGRRRRLERATWVTERVFHNHSHWLTAHLPKLLLLRSRSELENVLLPRERTPVIDASLRMVGLEPESFATFENEVVLEVDELTVLDTDRFRPELARLVRDALPSAPAVEPFRRIYISRARAARRQLVNEDRIWRLLEPAGFECVFMEDLPFAEQVRLMRETAVLAAPHGAGLTNMMFCSPGTHILEIADLGFPNPNFYALASALEHPYWLVPAESVGDGHPLERDMRVAPAAVDAALRSLDAVTGALS
jgi:hypothetical protein